MKKQIEVKLLHLNELGVNELNEYLYNCLYERNGLIGISLKQSVKNSSLIKINVGDTRHINRFKDFEISNNKKTSEIDFDFKKIGATNWQKGSGIDCRTFDSSPSSSISLEVKGKKGGSGTNNLSQFKIKENR